MRAILQRRKFRARGSWTPFMGQECGLVPVFDAGIHAVFIAILATVCLGGSVVKCWLQCHTFGFDSRSC